MAPQQQPLRVVVLLDRAPHSYKEGNEYKGLYVDLWKKIAAELRLSYIFYGESDTDKAVEAVSTGRYDAGCGSFSIQGDWIDQVNFCRPIEICSINIFRRATGTYASRVLNTRNLILFACTVIVYVVFLVLYCVLEPQKSGLDVFHDSFIQFLDKTEILPARESRSVGVRVLNIFFALFCFIFTTYIIVILIGGFFNTEKAYLDPDGIRTVAVLRGSVYEHYAREKGYETRVFSTQKEQFASGLDVLTLPFFVRAYGGGKNYIACREPLFFDERSFIVNYQKNDLVRRINQVIVSLRQRGEIMTLCHRYLGGEDTSCRIQGRG
ncbi:hypothetical protein EBZ80_04965 [bacterium]|nr:hypothetical protein [bacterium]